MGWWNPSNPVCKQRVADVLRKRVVSIPEDLNKFEVELEGIGTASETLHFFVSSGVLKCGEESWRSILTIL
ncbi:MAG: hypothetical protein QW365_08055 [Candidatus Nezhaarchaeales archaeon]